MVIIKWIEMAEKLAAQRENEKNVLFIRKIYTFLWFIIVHIGVCVYATASDMHQNAMKTSTVTSTNEDDTHTKRPSSDASPKIRIIKLLL